MAGALTKLGKQRDDFLNQEEQRKKQSSGALASYGKQRGRETNQGGIIGGAGYVLGNLGLGFASVGEGIADIAMAGTDLVRGDAEAARQRFLDNKTGEIQKQLAEAYNPSWGVQLAGDVASGIGNSATFLIPYAGPYLAALGYTGMGISGAAEKTGDVGLKELGYGVVSGGMEFLMDKFIGGAGQAAKNLGSTITRKLGREAAEAGAKATAKLAGKSFGKSVLTETLKGAAGEAIEEASQEALDPVLLRLFNIDENAKLDWKNVAYAGLIGGLSGGLMTAGPAAINYKSAVSTGKSIRESGETADFLEHARLVVKGAQRKQADFTAKKEAVKAAKDSKKAKAESGTDTGKAEASTGGIGSFIRGHRDAKASRRVSQLAETVQKNLTAYEGYLNKADKTAKELEISDAILGEMRGNVFLLENAALLESYEEAILELSDEDKAELVAEVNTRAKASGAKKTDYTVEDLNKDTDGILAGVAGNLLIRDNYGRYLRGNQEAKAADTSESPEGAVRDAEAATGEEVGAETSEGAKEAPGVKREAAPKRKGTVTVSDGMKPSKDFSDTQYAAYKAAEILSDSTGMDIEIHRDLTRDGRTVNGYYDQGTKVLHVNINAMRDGKQIALYTLGHEATHYIKDWSPEKFNVLADFVAKQMGTDMQTAVNEKLSSLFRLGLLKNLTAEQASELAREEVVADGMELIFTDGKVLEELARTDKSLWERIRDWFFDMIGQIRSSYRGLNQASKTAQVLQESMETLDEVERLFTEGVRDAGERAAESVYDTQNGVMIDDASGTAMFSIDDIPKNQNEVDAAVNRLVAKLGVDESRARQWVQNELSLATLILRDDMVDYAHRKADRRLTAIVKNSDYKQGTLDFSNICRKRREYTRMMQRIQQAFPNRRFTAEEFATIRKIMVDEGLEVACGLCYVEDRRQNEGYIAETFREAVKSWRKGNRENFFDTKNEESRAYNKGQTNAMNLIEKGDYLPTIADLTTVEGMEKLQKEHPDILRAWRGFNNARGMASARLLTGEAEYQRQILKYNRARVKQINDLGGLRIFSFSDFEEFHLLDIIQAVQDCAAMGIKIQFYTKVPSFALLMKDTKAKGNLSLIPKGDLGYVMMNGKPVLAYDPVEGIDFNDPAFKKVVRGNPNIGTILVGINDTQIRAAMEDDYIDYIIPFHSGQSTIVRQIKKIGKWENYKDSQTDKKLDPDSKAKPVNIYTDVIAAAEREGAPIRNERQFVERFLKVCKERGLKPRFEQFLKKNEAGEYVYTKGYYKLLLDFKMFDKDGTYLPQEAVIPEFDPKLLHELTKKYVAGEKAKTDKDTPAFNRALKRVTEEVVGGYDGIRYSIDETAEVSESKREETPFEKALRRSGLAHLIDGEAEAAEATEAEAKPTVERDTEAERRERIRDHEILADAFLEAAQSEQEFVLAKRYRQKAVELADAEARIRELRRKAAEVNREIEVLRAKRKSIDRSRPATEVEEAEAWMETELNEALSRKQGYLDERDRLGDMLQRETDRLLSMASAKPLRKTLREAQKKATAMERKVERAEKRAEERVEKVKKEYEFREEYKADRREMSVRERAARRVIGRLNTMFYNPTKTKHVPADLQALVEQVLKSEKLDTFKETRKNLRQMAELEREIEKLEQNPARTASEQERLDEMLYKYAAFEDEGLAAKGQAEALFTAFKTWMESKPKDQQDQALLDKLSSEIDGMQDMPLSQMSKKSLISVENFYKMIYHQVNNANKAFTTKKAVNIDKLSTKANREVVDSKALKVLSPTGKEWKAMTMIRKYLWGNMKPLTVFEAIGSKTLQDLFQGILDGEEVWARDVKEAEEFLTKVKKESGYNKWDMEQRSEVKTASGETVSLTLGEKLSLYAYMFRDQAEKHLSTGGFTFAPDARTIESFKKGNIRYEAVLNDQKQYQMRKKDIAVMAESLTPEQKKFAKDVQEYLTSLGKKGNDVSKQLYGIELFNEKAYFPIRSNRDYLVESTGKSGDPNIKSRGTFQETVPGAGNPIVLEDFMSVVTGHVNNMATYHAFVLPVEDFTRVWNYTPVNIKRDENGEAILDKDGMPIADEDAGRSYNSLKAEITKKYGKQANDYILQLIRDLNGGARRDAAASILDKGISSFKQATTMLSLSTIIQQPTSIFRAMAIIDGKYFTGAQMVDWKEIQNLAPVAYIKEMGGHDTSTGARTEEHLNAKEYDSLGDKVKAMLKPKAYGGDPHARAEAFGFLTGKADELAWRLMFGACLNEQADKLGKAKNSKEVKEAAAKRFTEVVRKTQVYDSTLTRSEWMRSKDGLMKIVTSFSAEPTTVMSMMAEAIIKQQRGDKKAVRTIGGAVALSVMATAVASSLIYAMRDDDEDETFLEKYLQSLASETLEGINPLEYMPVARDVMSLFKGYEIERTDMTLVSNLFEQIELITSSKRSVPDKIFGVSGAIAAFFGVPVTNVYRDTKGFVNTILGFGNAETQTAAGVKHAMGDSVRSQFNLFAKLFGAESGNAYELYTAFVRGDTAHYNRVAARYESEAVVEQALRKELRERDRRIGEAAEARMAGELDVYESIIEQIAGEGIFERNMIIRAINNEINALKDAAERGKLVPKDEEAAAEAEEEVLSLYSTSDLNDALERGDREDYAWIYQTLVTGKTEQGKTEAQAKASVKSSVTAYWKKRYIAAWEANDTAEIKRIQSILLSTGLYGNRNEVAKLGQGWVKAYAAGKK